MTAPSDLLLLIDNALSPSLAEFLRKRGVDAVHVRDLGMSAASDSEILARAAHEGRILVSRDADFSGLLAHGGLTWPSFVHLRIHGLHDPAAQAELIAEVLERFATDLTDGAVVTVHHRRVRVRGLPLIRE